MTSSSIVPCIVTGDEELSTKESSDTGPAVGLSSGDDSDPESLRGPMSYAGSVAGTVAPHGGDDFTPKPKQPQLCMFKQPPPGVP